MARTKENDLFETRTKRLKLQTQKRYINKIGLELSLVYRRDKSGVGSFSCRVGGHDYKTFSIGEADDYKDADGQTIFNYYQAVDFARKIEASQKRLSGLVKTNYTITEACKDYFEWYKVNRKQPKKVETSIKNMILPRFGNIEITKLTTKMITNWLNEMATSPKIHKGGYKNKMVIGKVPQTDDEKRARKATANRNYAVLRAILNKAFYDGYVDDRREWERVRPFRNTDQARIRFLTSYEVKLLLNNCHEIDLKRFIAGALFTGARYSELEHALVCDYNKDTGFFYIRPSKNGKARYVPLNAQGRELFEACIVGKASDDFIFTKNGQRWKQANLYYRYCLACKGAKLGKITFHELRHTYASNLAQNGVDLLTISKLLGHTNPAITARHYAHLCDKTLIQAVEKLGFEYQDSEMGKVVSIG